MLVMWCWNVETKIKATLVQLKLQKTIKCKKMSCFQYKHKEQDNSILDMFDKCKKIKGFFNHKHQLRTEKKSLKRKSYISSKSSPTIQCIWRTDKSTNITGETGAGILNQSVLWSGCGTEEKNKGKRNHSHNVQCSTLNSAFAPQPVD